MSEARGPWSPLREGRHGDLPLRVGLLGAGRIGSFHAHTLAFGTPDAKLVAIADPSKAAADRLAEATRTERRCADPEEIISDPSIRAVVITTPGATHTDLIARAAAAGKHVFCEKPIGLELPEIDAALEAVRRAGVKLQIGFQRRFDPGYARARRMVEEGRLGRLYMIHSRTRDPEVPGPEYLRSCGGLFRDTSVHDLDSIRWLAGCEIEEVYAAGSALVDPVVEQAGDVDTAIITLRLENGTIATVDNSRRAVYGYDVRVEVFGSEGSVEVGHPSPTVLLHLSNQGVSHDLPYLFTDRFRAAYEEEIRAFVRCVLDDSQPLVTGEDGRAATALGIAAHRSLATGLPVRLGDQS